MVFALAGLNVEASGFKRFGWVCGLCTVIPSLFYLVAVPDMNFFGGLSGLATGAAAYYAGCRLVIAKKGSGFWKILLGIMAIKIVLEAAIDQPLFVQVQHTDFQVMTSAHVIGFMAAVAMLKPFDVQATKVKA